MIAIVSTSILTGLCLELIFEIYILIIASCKETLGRQAVETVLGYKSSGQSKTVLPSSLLKQMSKAKLFPYLIKFYIALHSNTAINITKN